MKHRRRMQAEIAANEAAKLAASGKRQYKAPEEKKERVFEFTLECQLDHTRACQLEDGNRVPIQCLAVGGPGGEEDYLFSASEDGSICIFSRPEDDLKFPVVQRIHDHKLAVTSMITTEFYFMSTSDDNTLRVYGMIDNTDMDKILSPSEGRSSSLDVDMGSAWSSGRSPSARDQESAFNEAPTETMASTSSSTVRRPASRPSLVERTPLAQITSTSRGARR